MIKITELEKKIRWYLENIEETITLETLDLIKSTEFNEEGRLNFHPVNPDEILIYKEEKENLRVEIGNLKKPRKKAKPTKYGDISEIARELDNL